MDLPPSGAQGIEYPDGMLVLTWTAAAGVIQWEIELVPVDSSFDGQGTFLQGGAACMAEMAPTLGPGICTDLDGDGRAGYPDAG